MAASVEATLQDVAAWLKGVAGALAPRTYIVAPGDAAGGIEVGDLEELTLGSGEVKPVKVMAIDTISYPPRAKVSIVDAEGQTTDEILVVPVLQEKDVERTPAWALRNNVMVDAGKTTVYQDYEDAFTLHHKLEDGVEAMRLADDSDRSSDVPDDAPPLQKRISGAEVGQAILHGVSQEWQLTVQDVREKGAVGALRDAALDAVDCVGSAAGIAADKARSLMNQQERKEGAIADNTDAGTENQLTSPVMAKLPCGASVTLGPQLAA